MGMEVFNKPIRFQKDKSLTNKVMWNTPSQHIDQNGPKEEQWMHEKIKSLWRTPQKKETSEDEMPKEEFF